jgi:hypothetical protein
MRVSRAYRTWEAPAASILPRPGVDLLSGEAVTPWPAGVLPAIDATPRRLWIGCRGHAFEVVDDDGDRLEALAVEGAAATSASGTQFQARSSAMRARPSRR